MEHAPPTHRAYLLLTDALVRMPSLVLIAVLIAAMAMMLAMSPPPVSVTGEVVVAAAVALLLAVVLARAGDGVATVGGAIVGIGLIAFVRHHTGGGGSGMSALFMVPIIWLAMYGTLRQAAIGVAAVLVALAAPIVLFGPPHYTTTEELRRVVAVAIVASIIVLLTWWGRRELLTDPLTRTGNRRLWEREIAREMSRAGRAGEHMEVAIIDLDEFKRYNDRHGHLAGDRHLIECATAWQRALRREDLLVRAGGEEFFLLLPRTAPDEADSVLERVRAVTPNGQTCSIGHAAWDGRETTGEVLHRADEALYRAKSRGRDRVVAAESPQLHT